MKTLKAKPKGKPKKAAKAGAISKPKKTSGTVKAVKSRKETAGKSEPGEVEIRKKANEIYLQRIARGEQGTPSEDWQKAEEFLRGS